MPSRSLSFDELASRGEAAYRSSIVPRLTAEDEGKVVLIDVESGDYELDADELRAADRLRRRRPQAQVWFRRVGQRAARRYGRRASR